MDGSWDKLLAFETVRLGTLGILGDGAGLRSFETLVMLTDLIIANISAVNLSSSIAWRFYSMTVA